MLDVCTGVHAVYSKTEEEQMKADSQGAAVQHFSYFAVMDHLNPDTCEEKNIREKLAATKMRWGFCLSQNRFRFQEQYPDSQVLYY